MRTLAILGSLALGGCGMIADYQAAEQTKERRAAFETAIADCRNQFPLGVPRAKCFNEAEVRIFYDDPFPDLANVRRAKRVELAGKVERKEMTSDQADLEFAQVTAQLTSEVERRSAQRISANAQQTAANASVMGAIAASRPVTCNRMGNSVTCF